MCRRILLVLAMLFTFSYAFAGPNQAAKFRHADRNNDGVVDKKEMRMEHAWERRHWFQNRSKVNTAIEEKYDANHDGWIEAAEARERLKDRLELIKTEGKARVDTAIEAEYDANHDGIIDETEGKSLTEDLK